MKKEVLIISTSLRNNSNSDMLANSFKNGAESVGHHVEQVSLKDKTIGFCKGCLACQKTGNCVIHDDAEEIVQKMAKVDVLVFATPIYYYEMSGQMKTMLDRANPLYSADYSYREVYLLAAAAEEEETAMDGAKKGLQGFVDCFEKAHLVGTVFTGGVNDSGEVKGHMALETAYEMGRNI
ncbi:MAG: flavodoxin family protein [Clostridiales bacterium]|nr:flavodoxin family protein [Clostridiales bacterium]